MDAVGVARAHVCGISIGGLTALWLGLYAPAHLSNVERPGEFTQAVLQFLECSREPPPT